MADYYEKVFDPDMIQEMLFFNLKAVLIHPTLLKLEENNNDLFKRWDYISKKFITKPENNDLEYLQEIYEKNAIYYPEFTKIVAITYATVYVENGTLKRYMKKITNDNEFIVLATFMDELHQLSGDGVKSSPQFFPTFCGHNIINYDIPHLLKKYVYYRENFEGKKIPYILKRTLAMKPWESGIIDTVNVWKFNGKDYSPLMLISDFLGFKKTVDLLSLDKVSKEYWKLINTEPEKALEFVSLQSATQTNLVIQLIRTLRNL